MSQLALDLAAAPAPPRYTYVTSPPRLAAEKRATCEICGVAGADDETGPVLVQLEYVAIPEWPGQARCLDPGTYRGRLRGNASDYHGCIRGHEKCLLLYRLLAHMEDG